MRSEIQEETNLVGTNEDSAATQNMATAAANTRGRGQDVNVKMTPTCDKDTSKERTLKKMPLLRTLPLRMPCQIHLSKL